MLDSYIQSIGYIQSRRIDKYPAKLIHGIIQIFRFRSYFRLSKTQPPDTNLNPIAFHPQKNLYLCPIKMSQEKFKFHTTTTTI